MGNLRDAIWFVDSENDDLRALVDRMRQIANAMLPEIAYEFNDSEIVDYVKLPMELRRNFFLCFKEMINNIARHAAASKS